VEVPCSGCYVATDFIDVQETDAPLLPYTMAASAANVRLAAAQRMYACAAAPAWCSVWPQPATTCIFVTGLLCLPLLLPLP
jgi:hypothetical protein